MIEVLQFITRGRTPAEHLAGAAAALAGGVAWIQLRMKGAAPALVRESARHLQEMCEERGALLIINDDPALAAEIGASGAHVGSTDMPAAEARRILRPGQILGGTANTVDDLERLAEARVDYIGIGPFRPTATKEHLAPILGLGGIRQLVRWVEEHHLPIPLIAVGGITAADVPPLLRAGVHGVAVSGAIVGARDPVGAAAELCRCCGKMTAVYQEGWAYE